MKNPTIRGKLQKKTLKERPKKSLKILDAIEECAKTVKTESENESKYKASYENLHDLLKAVKKESKLTSKTTEKSKEVHTVKHVKEKPTKKEMIDKQESKCKLNKENIINKSDKNKRKAVVSDVADIAVKKKIKKPIENQFQKSKDTKKIKQIHEIKAEVIDNAVESKSQKSKSNKKVEKIQQATIKIENKKEKTTKVRKAKNKNTEELIGNLELNKMNVEKAVDVVFQLAQKEKQEKKSLLPFEGNSIFLQINCIKIPTVPRRRIRMLLPNVMSSSTDEVALFVPDLERGRRKDHEKTVEHWEMTLQEKGVTNINAIIPMNQVKNEYNQYEMRRKLARLYDFFLVDGRIAGHITHLLGKSFTRLSTPPVPIRLHRENLKEEINKALKKTTLEIHGYGPCHTVKIATLSMPQKKVVKNILAICEQLKEKYPGGFDNIRSILIKTKSSLAIPIYYSIKHKNEVPVPIVRPKRPKAFTVVEGELSTLESDVKVSVTPSGRVKVAPIDEAKEIEETVIISKTKEPEPKLNQTQAEKERKEKKIDKTIKKKLAASKEKKPIKQKKIKIKQEINK